MNLQGMENAYEDKNLVDNEQDDFSESFVCCVCLDLLYKPIVLTCGHISCFWCVHHSMNYLRESHCPICRHPYYHFPTICQMLHFLLLKMYPVAYNRRENQTLEEEKERGYYSPQFESETHVSEAKINHSGSSSSCSVINLASNPLSAGASVSMEKSGSANPKQDEGTICIKHISDGIPGVVETLSVQGNNLPQNEHRGQQKISVADVMCPACKQLLFHPVVLNCGHVYCESCIMNSADEMLRCQICQSPHPRGFPKVCLELDHFLEEHFPEEYAQQRDAVTPSSCSLVNWKGEKIAWWSGPHSKVHIGVGCDFCGMYPIVGDRYRCKDCKEEIGFDLCGDCYKTSPKLPGRFNQQHTSEHKFEQINMVPNIMRLVSGQVGDSLIESLVLTDDEEDTQNDSEGTN